MKNTAWAGFSLIELMIVVAVGAVVSVIAMPNMMTGISTIRMRSNMTSLAGVLQNCRILAVKENRNMTTHFDSSSFGIVAYVKRSTDTSNVGSKDSQVELEAPVTKMVSPSGGDAPSTLDTSVLGFTPETVDPSFNPTGLPCVYASGACQNKGFAFYFHDNRAQGKMNWAALSISPAGRMKKWFWNGSAWVD